MITLTFLEHYAAPLSIPESAYIVKALTSLLLLQCLKALTFFILKTLTWKRLHCESAYIVKGGMKALTFFHNFYTWKRLHFHKIFTTLWKRFHRM